MDNEVTERTISVGAIRVFHRTMVGGTSHRSIILLHGWSFTSAIWEQFGLFKSLGSIGFDVYAVDYPGFGNSRTSGGYSIETGDISKGSIFVRDYIRALGLKKTYLLGASMGGGIAMRSCIDFQDLVSGVIAIAPAWIGSYRKQLADISVPVCFIWGSSDNVVSLSLGREYAGIVKNSSLHVLDGAGHAAYLDRPEKFLDVVTSFLKAQS